MTRQSAISAVGAPLIEVYGLRVDYGLGPDAVHAVIDADLTLVSGSVLGLAGESGSGKSTLAYAITRLLRAPGVIAGGQVLLHSGTAAGSAAGPAGTIDLLAADESRLRELRWSRIAVVMQSAMHALNPVITVGAQLIDVLRAHQQRMDKAARVRRAAQLLEMVGISPDHLGHYPHQLSGGMRQRVMIAMALSCSPSLLIADEPTSALDITIQAQVLTLMKELIEEIRTSILFISHDLGVIAEMADDVGVMYAGHLVEFGPVAEVYTQPRHPYTKALLRANPRQYKGDGPLPSLPGSVPNLSRLPPGCTFHPRCALARPECREPPGPRLEPVSGSPGHRTACYFSEEVATLP